MLEVKLEICDVCFIKRAPWTKRYKQGHYVISHFDACKIKWIFKINYSSYIVIIEQLYNHSKYTESEVSIGEEIQTA